MESEAGEPAAVAQQQRVQTSDDEWKTCCSDTSAEFVKFCAQLVVCVMVLAFAIAMMAMGHKDPYYPSLITLILGLFLPEPQIKGRRKN
jgi:hypothetical protein